MSAFLDLPSKVWTDFLIVRAFGLRCFRIGPNPHRWGVLSIASIILMALCMPFDTQAQGGCFPLNDDRTSPDERLQALKAGGYALIFRHAPKGETIDRECTEPENGITTGEGSGTEQAQDIGSILAELEVPIAMIQSSEYCRTIQTAEEIRNGYLAERENSDRDIDLQDLPRWNLSSDVNGMSDALEALKVDYRNYIHASERPTNVIVVTHSLNLDACLNDSKVRFLEAAIVDLDCSLECPIANRVLRIENTETEHWMRSFEQGP